MDIEKLFKELEEKKTVIMVNGRQTCGVRWEDIRRAFDKFKRTELVTIPQNVADWIEFFKKRGCTLQESIYPQIYHGIAILGNFENEVPGSDISQILSWISHNGETYIRAWVCGYKIEEDKRYLVKIKVTGDYLYVNNFSKPSFSSAFKTEVTKTMLDNLGLSEVFSNPLFEVEEIKTKS